MHFVVQICFFDANKTALLMVGWLVGWLGVNLVQHVTSMCGLLSMGESAITAIDLQWNPHSKTIYLGVPTIHDHTYTTRRIS